MINRFRFSVWNCGLSVVCFNRLLIVATALLISVVSATAQTNPATQTLPFTQDFGISSFSSYPAGIRGWTPTARQTTQSGAETVAAGGNAAISAASSTTGNAGVYGYSFFFNARLYLQSASSGTTATPQIAAAVKMGSNNAVRISYKLERLRNGSTGTDMGVVLQYREGTSGGWTTVPGSATLVTSTTTPSFIVSGLTPSKNYQFRWSTWIAQTGNPTTYPGIGLDDISISGYSLLVGSISRTSHCLLQTAPSASFTVGFTSSGSFTSNSYHVELSNASGSFASPVVIGTLVSNSNSGNISCTIPSNMPAGTGYKIRIRSTNPAIVSPIASATLTVTKAQNSISPTGTQNISVGEYGNPLTVTESGTTTSRQWAYSETPGGPYNDLTGETGQTVTPISSVQGNFFGVCKSTFAGCGTVISNEVNIKISATVSVGTLSSNNICVSSSAATPIAIPFTSAGVFTSNTYTAQLSNSSGSFSAPITLGTLVSNANSGTIAAQLPANLPSGTGYIIRVNASNPSVIGKNSTPITINLKNNTINPPGDQSILAGANGQGVNTNAGGASVQWAYSTTSGGNLTNISGATSSSYTPNFSAQGVYYLQSRALFPGCNEIKSNEVKITVSPTIAAGIVQGAPFCVTANSGSAINIPFTSGGVFSSNTYTAELSNQSGSFSSPVVLGTLTSNANGGTISGTIPANTPTGNGYRVRVSSSNPSLVSSPSAQQFTINLRTNSISPTTTQNINAGVNGNNLNANAQNANSLQWAYSLTAGGPYTNISGASGSTYIPNFSVQGSYYIVCMATFAGCGTLTSNEVLVNVNAVIAGPTVGGSPFCVSAAGGAPVNVSFNSSGSFTSNTYTAELSNSAGSFSSPLAIGSLVSNANSGTISAQIPAATASGTNYRIRVVSSNPAVNGAQSTNQLTVNFRQSVVSPAATQHIDAATNGAQLSVSDAGANSRIWAYSLTSGGPYTDISGTNGLSYYPNFSAQGTYYVVCKSNFSGCGVLISNEVVVNVSQRINVTTPSTQCVTSSSSTALNVSFTSKGSFLSGNQYRVELSDASGSFSSPLQLGSITSQSNSGTIPSTLPADLPYSTAYKIRVVSTNPVVVGDASGAFTINLRSNSISPTASQTILVNTAGTTLSCTDVTAPTSRRWAYSTTEGGPYTDISGSAGSGVNYSPKFSSVGIYYVVCKSTYSTCGTVISNEVEINVVNTLPPAVTLFTPTSGVTGTTVTIKGTNFSNVNQVTFGGIAATSFTVVNSTTITAVVGIGNTGDVVLTSPSGSSSLGTFNYEPLNFIYTDFNNFWTSGALLQNGLLPNNSHNLLSFRYAGINYSTGVDDAKLAAQGVTFTAGNWKAAPIAGLNGVVSSNNVLIVTGSMKDGDPVNALPNSNPIKDLTMPFVLTDGNRGLDLGTGITNLPVSAVINLSVKVIDDSKISDDEPDILISQIAAPTGSLDTYEFLDAGGNVVGNSITRSQTSLPPLGAQRLDLFNLSSGEQLSTAKVNGDLFEPPGSSREIRLSAYKLSEFGITAANYAQIKTFRIKPSGSSDPAFIGYNNNAIKFNPTVFVDIANSLTAVCSGQSAVMKVLAAAGNDGTLSYQWERSTNSGGSWTSITNGANYSGVTTQTLTASAQAVGTYFRVRVTESTTGYFSYSEPFIIASGSYTAPTISTQPTDKNICVNMNAVLNVTASGGSSVYGYQWQKQVGAVWQNIANATASTYLPPTDMVGTTAYRVVVSNIGCSGSVTSSSASVVINGGGTVATPTVSRCTPGSVTLTASAPGSSSIKWYNDIGDVVGSGTSFVTPSLSSSKTYYVVASYSSPSCNSQASPALAEILTTPSMVSATGDSRCGSGAVNLSASPSAGVSRWYTASSGGSLLYTGNNYTPTLSGSQTFYVEAFNNGCASTRTAVSAVVKTIPSIDNSSSQSICGSGTVSLSAYSSAGTVGWYNQPSGGTLLYTGNNYSPYLSSTTSYYVEAAAAGCTTQVRTPVTATIKTVPAITSSSGAEICGVGSVTLSASASAGTISWYTAPVGGSPVATGSSYSPTITATTNYFVEATLSGCSTATRTTVIAKSKQIPSIASASSNARCGAGVINLSASSTSGVVKWYTSVTGGTAIATGNNFSPNITQSQIYYAEADNAGCISASRSPVSANIDEVNGGSVSITGSDSICYIAGSKTLNLSGEIGSIIKWQSSLNGSSWTDIPSTAQSYLLTNLVTNTFYRTVVDGGSCGTRNSAAAFVKVKVCSPDLPEPSPAVPPLISAGNYQYYKRDSVYEIDVHALAGAQLRWYTQPSGGSFTTTTPIVSTGSVMQSTYYVSQFAAGMESVRVPVTITVKPITWYGGGGDNWETGGSWRGGRVPLAGDEVFIENNPINPPTLDQDRVIGKLYFGSGANSYVKLNGNKLTLQDSIVGVARFESDEISELEINGPSENTIAFINGGNKIKNFSVANNAAKIKLGSNLDVYGAFSVSAGTFDLNGDTVSLKAGIYPEVGMIGNTSGIIHQSNGLFMIERFIPARRANRLLAASVNSINSIKDNWQEGVNNTNKTYSTYLNPHPGYGTHITGSKTGANGFDITQTGNPSMWTYDNNAVNWVAIPNTNVRKLYAGEAYRMIIRGDRSINMNTNTPTPNNTILRSYGTILQNSQTISLSAIAGRYNLIGNPYASAVDLSTVTKTNAADVIYIFDPNMPNGAAPADNDAFNKGAYVAFDLSTGTSSMSDESEVNKYLQPGQAFFIQTKNNGPASITFNETDKNTEETTKTFKNANSAVSRFQINLFPDTAYSLKAIDGCAVVFGSQYSNNLLVGEDAPKIANAYENIAILKNNSSVSIEKRPYPTNDDTIQLKITGFVGTEYILSIASMHFNEPGLDAYLYDRYTQMMTPLPANDNFTTGFSIDNNIADSKAPNRFAIVFKVATTLPIEFLNVKAYKHEGSSVVEWSTSNDKEVDKYEVEHSPDGKKFETKGIVPGLKSEGTANYQWKDYSPFEGDNFYRIKSFDVQGKTKYSAIVKLVFGEKGAPFVSVYPNPVSGRTIHLTMKNIEKSVYNFSMLNMAGVEVYRGSFDYDGVSAKPLSLPKSMAAGSYVLKLSNDVHQHRVTVVVQ